MTATLTDILQTGWSKCQHRITRKTFSWPVADPPYTPTTGFPQIVGSEEVKIISDYTIDMSDGLSADKITLTAVLGAGGRWSDYFDANDLILIEEQWSNSAGETEWFSRGVFLLDGCELMAEIGGGRQSISGMSVTGQLNVNPFNGKFAADKLFVSRHQMTLTDSPTITPGLRYYKFVDGTAQSHTYNWAASPVPKLWIHSNSDPNNPKRVRYKDGCVDMLYGSGELFIEKDFYENSIDDGGLGNPPGVDAQYYRLATENDVIGTNPNDPCDPTDSTLSPDTYVAVRSIVQNGDSTWTVSFKKMPSGTQLDTQSTWAGCTITMFSGNALYRDYKIISVNTGAKTVTISKSYNLTGDGVAVGDKVRVINTNRVEWVLKKLFLYGGFQDVDPDEPFYIRRIEPLRYVIYTPTASEFEFVYEDDICPLGIIERIRKYLPPNYVVYGNTVGELECGYVTQLATGDADVVPFSQITKADYSRSNTSIYTKVRYSVRDRAYKNLASLANGSLEYAYVPNRNSASAVARELAALNDAVEGVNMANGHPLDYYMQDTDKADRDGLAKRIVDGTANTWAAWFCSNCGSTDMWKFWNNTILCELKLAEAHKLKEVHIIPTGPHTGGVFDIQYSADRIQWESLTDEFTYGGRQPKVFTDMPKEAVQYLRVINIMPDYWKGVSALNEVSHRIYTGIAEIAIYADDIHEAFVELGSNDGRFNITTWAKTVSPSVLGINVTPESHWIGKRVFAYTSNGVKIFTVTQISTDPLQVTVTPNPVGLVAGNDMLVVEQGESDAEFAMDVARRQRLGVKLYNVPGPDEYGSFTAQSLGIDLDTYARVQGLTWLAEQQQEFVPINLGGIRPDVMPRKTLVASIPKLGVGQTNMLITSVNLTAKGLVSVKAVPYAGINWGV